MIVARSLIETRPSPAHAVEPTTTSKKFRDVRLDFFRGLSLFIILVSHTRGDFLADWIPARFGLSDAADMFVFVSGYAGGIAFGGVYRRSGWILGTVRIGLRVWQLYLAQLCMILASAALALAADRLLGASGNHVALFSLDHLFSNPRDAILGAVTLTYVPQYLDILPLYIVVLAMVPVAVALARIHPYFAPIASAVLWVVARASGWNLPNESSEPSGWFFNPFCWQLLFFSGFSISMGWVRPPPPNRLLFRAAVGWLVFGVTVTVPAIFETIPRLGLVHAWTASQADKTMLDPLRYLHFLASAYVVIVLLRGRLHLIQRRWASPLIKCGQQALAVFLAGILLADIGGIVFDHLGTNLIVQLVVNAGCFAATFAVAYGVAWVKSAPWALPAPVAAIGESVRKRPPSGRSPELSGSLPARREAATRLPVSAG